MRHMSRSLSVAVIMLSLMLFGAIPVLAGTSGQHLTFTDNVGGVGSVGLSGQNQNGTWTYQCVQVFTNILGHRVANSYWWWKGWVNFSQWSDSNCSQPAPSGIRQQQWSVPSWNPAEDWYCFSNTPLPNGNGCWCDQC